MAISTRRFRVVSVVALVRARFRVQRASRSFWASLLGWSCQPLGLVLPAFWDVARFDRLLLRIRVALLAAEPDGLGIWNRMLQPEPKKAHEREAVADLELGGVIREGVQGLEHHDLEHQHWIVRRPAPTGAVRALQS